MRQIKVARKLSLCAQRLKQLRSKGAMQFKQISLLKRGRRFKSYLYSKRYTIARRHNSIVRPAVQIHRVLSGKIVQKRLNSNAGTDSVSVINLSVQFNRRDVLSTCRLDALSLRNV